MRRTGHSQRMVIGLILLVLGILFLVDNYSTWYFPRETLWPILLIAIGLANLLRRGSSRWPGVVLTAIGMVFLLDELDVWTFHMRDIGRLWPLILVLVGVRVIFGGRRRRARKTSPRRSVVDSASGGLDVTCVFSSTETRITASSFSGGQATTVFGSAVLHLHDAALAGGEATIDATVLFGTIELRVPAGWMVDLRSTNILGGAHDERGSLPNDGRNRLAVTGMCMFGSIVVKS